MNDTELSEIFGKELRLTENQNGTLEHLLAGKNVFLSLQTGGGKSMCYQAFPVKYRRKLTSSSSSCTVLIVSPLLSIMEEQVIFLKSLGMKASYIGRSVDEDNIIFSSCSDMDFIFTSPEHILSNEKWRNFLTVNRECFKLFVVDEAHTVVNWSESHHEDDPFRHWFGKLGEVQSLIKCPTLVITATASRASRKKIKKSLNLIVCEDIVVSPERENIKLFISKIASAESLDETFSWLFKLLEEKLEAVPRILIFCSSIKTCASLFTIFRIHLLESTLSFVQMYHSCTSEDTKLEIRQDMEIDGKIRVLICTSAAGMGVNFNYVNYVIHYGPTHDMDSLVQQIGRAARDGSQGYELLLFKGNQLTRKVDDDMRDYCKNDTCRRMTILKAYDATADEGRLKHLCCDVCEKLCDCGYPVCGEFQHIYFKYRNEAPQGDSSSERSEDSE